MKNKLFLSALAFLIVFSAAFTLVREPRKISALENRLLGQFPEFHIEDFIRGEFQKNWEIALGDQFAGSTTLKRWYNRYKLGSIRFFFEAVKPLLPKRSRVSPSAEPDSDRKNAVSFEAIYIPKGENIFQIEPGGNFIISDYNEQYLVSLKRQLDQIIRDLIRIQSPLFPKYYMYYIEELRDIDFSNRQITHLFSDAAKQQFSAIGEFSAFTLGSLEEFQQKMYRSDHHWNHIGQIEGYRDVVHLLLGDEEPLLNITPKRIPGISYTGSLGRSVSDFSIHDDFYVGDVDLPPYHVIISGVEEEAAESYGKEKEYLDGIFSNAAEINHYGECFGPDTGLITFDFHSPDKENLLMIVDSYSNPTNAWIASHFNRTYIVDLRHYRDYIGVPFSVSEFVFANDIGKVLIMGSGSMLRNTTFQLESSSETP